MPVDQLLFFGNQGHRKTGETKPEKDKLLISETELPTPDVNHTHGNRRSLADRSELGLHSVIFDPQNEPL